MQRTNAMTTRVAPELQIGDSSRLWLGPEDFSAKAFLWPLQGSLGGNI
jgi:hypothetical protein